MLDVNLGVSVSQVIFRLFFFFSSSGRADFLSIHSTDSEYLLLGAD